MHRLIDSYLTFFVFFIWIGAASAQASKVSLDTEFSLRVGQTVTIEDEGLVIKFKAVLEDSRCPVNAVCVWAGNGKAELEVIEIAGQNKTVLLNTEDKPKEIALKGHELKLIALNPPRIDGVSISSGDYAVTLYVKKK
ncbi:hypothetical protein [Methylomonas rivi]|uniref:Copper-binding protein n=1 Tax=Methylomonas rivi TaxID=2952226 RepID=A0ABT1U2Y7_9GAMM|nr:hypothetical protein [Methylomonas sp. WSC-6]MCQ8127790.1 hypothetical protein [Methylomonas sp. WSC-6]